MSQEYVVGQRLGDYEILGTLGAGGMGKVYKVRNVITDRIEAMKVLLPSLAGQSDLADRFQREIKLLASLSHPNIAALRTALTLDDQLVMVMEYVEGVTLSACLQKGPIPYPEAINYVDQMLAALSYAHQKNIVHRDIKPSNMMLTPQGLVKLMDFGIARSGNDRGLTMTGATLGSLCYMSPEQVKSEPVDARSDLYSVGVSLYEMVTGQLPFQAESSYSLMAAHLEQAPKPPITLRSDLPAALNAIILMALAKEPARRFQSADAFRNALKNVTAGVPAAASAVVPVAPSSLPLQSSAPVASGTTLTATPAYSKTQREAIASAPVAAQAAPAPAAAQTSRRGLYVALGGLLVVALLVVAGLTLPRKAKIQASGDSPVPAGKQVSTPLPAPASPASPASPISSPSSANPPDAAPAAASSSFGAPPSAPAEPPSSLSNPPAAETLASQPDKIAPRAGKHADAATKTPSSRAGQAALAQPPQEGAAAIPAVDPAEFEKLEQQADQLSSRASAVSQSIDGLRKQQSAQGYGLRGDISSSQERMENYMSKAQAALQAQDAKNTKKYLELAETEVEKLEKFLGR
jgi:serine/threonine protein kinase